MNYNLTILKQDFEAIEIEEIEKFEEKIGYKLPEDYKDFILLYNGSWTGREIYKYKRINNENGISEEISLWIKNFVSIRRNIYVGLYNGYKNERPDRKYLKIAEGANGKMNIYLSLNEETYGNIYHNDGAVYYYKEIPSEEYYYKIADNFTDFLKGFIYEPEEPHPYYNEFFWTTVP